MSGKSKNRKQITGEPEFGKQCVGPLARVPYQVWIGRMVAEKSVTKNIGYGRNVEK